MFGNADTKQVFWYNDIKNESHKRSCRMSFVTNPCQQLSLDDSTYQLTDRERRFLEKSWGTYFADHVFPYIDEQMFSVLYSDNKASRPNTPVNVLFGANILKENFGQTDDEIIEALMFDVRYQVALHTTSFKEQPLSDKSLERFRRRLLEYEAETGIDLVHECMVRLSSQMAAFLKISGSVKRMDSLMIESNIRKMSRLELLYTCTANMVQLLSKNREAGLISGMEHYTEADDRNRVIYHNHSEETAEKIEVILADAMKLMQSVPEQYTDSSEWILLKKVLSQQTVLEDGKFRLRTKEEGLSGLIQNPYDPEATYRRKAGKGHVGYTANVIEDVSVTEDGKTDASIITDYQVEQNTYSDSQFMKDEIARLGKQEDEVTIITDGAYGSKEAQKLSAGNNINHVPTDLTGRDVNEFLAEFKMNEDGTQVLECPNGEAPKACNYNKTTGICRTSFYASKCSACPYKEQCRPRFHKRTTVLMISKGQIARAVKQAKMKTSEYKQYGRIRNGVETIPSMLRRFCHVDAMPVRGRLRIKQRFGFMIGAVNFRKLRRQKPQDTYAQTTVIAAFG